MNYNKMNFKEGNNDPLVGELQTYLRACGFYEGKIDNNYGQTTAAAVKLLQEKQGNVQDGEFGPETFAKSDLNTVDLSDTVTSVEVSTNKVKELLIYFKKQPDVVTCGPTSLNMAFSYYDVDVTIETLRKLCKTDKNGTSPANLVATVPKVNKNFVLAEEDYKNFDQIAKHIDNKNPMIIQLQTISELGYVGSYGHYVTLTGYNKSNNTVKIADPSRTIKWFPVAILKKAIDKRLTLGWIKPVKILKKK